MAERDLSPLELLARIVGTWLWRSAHRSGAGAPWAARIAPPLLFALTVLTAVATPLISGSVSRTADRVRMRPAGVPLAASAATLDALAGKAWVRLLPGLGKRVADLSGRIREGVPTLQVLLDTYEAKRNDLNTFALPGRLIEGPSAVEPVQDALEQITTPWHRGTLVWSEVDRGLVPYRDLRRSPRTEVAGTVRAAPPRHLLALAAGDGTPFLGGVGDRFKVSIGTGAIRASAVSESQRRVLEDRVVPVLEWGPEITFSASGLLYRVAFTQELLAAAPALPPLSEDARAELAGEEAR